MGRGKLSHFCSEISLHLTAWNLLFIICGVSCRRRFFSAINTELGWLGVVVLFHLCCLLKKIRLNKPKPCNCSNFFMHQASYLRSGSHNARANLTPSVVFYCSGLFSSSSKERLTPKKRSESLVRSFKSSESHFTKPKASRVHSSQCMRSSLREKLLILAIITPGLREVRKSTRFAGSKLRPENPNHPKLSPSLGCHPKGWCVKASDQEEDSLGKLRNGVEQRLFDICQQQNLAQITEILIPLCHLSC